MDDKRLISFLKLLIFGPTPEQQNKANGIKRMFKEAEKEGCTYRVNRFGGIYKEKINAVHKKHSN